MSINNLNEEDNIDTFLKMTSEDQLQNYIKKKEQENGKKMKTAEKQFLQFRRRRMSLEMKKEKLQPTKSLVKTRELLQKYLCANSYPYKIMILGDEETSGKVQVIQLLTMHELIQKNLKLLNSKKLPPVEIQTKIIEVEKEDNKRHNYCLQLWTPYTSEDFDEVRPMYYSGTDAFVIFFDIKSKQSFDKVENIYLKEIQEYIKINEIHNDIPIILVGNHAEARSEKSLENELVPSKQAVLLAKKNGVSKYIEIYSQNLYHIHEIFQQSIHAIEQLHSSTQEDIPLQQREGYSQQEDLFFRSVLTVPTPEAKFDQLQKTFELDEEENVEYYYSLDESEPNKITSKKYNGIIKLKKPYPKSIKVVGYKRGYYISEIEKFEIPEDSDIPDGFFDTFTKAFHILRKHNTTYFITLDGTEPNEDSIIYEDPGIFFDNNQKPNECFGETFQIPEVIKVIAVEEGKFKSKSKTYHPFSVLAPPTVHFNGSDNMLKIETQPGIVYKYTLDGSVPTYESMTYTGPVMLPRIKGNCLKVAAFPKYYFPSKVVTINKPLGSNKSPSKSPKYQSIKMTKAMLNRSQNKNSTLSNSPKSNNSSFSTSSISSFNNNYNNNNQSPSSKYHHKNFKKGSNSPNIVRKQKGLKSSITLQEQETAMHRKRMSKKSPKKFSQKKQQFPISDPKQEVSVTCKAEGTNVEFEFEKFVYVSKIIVKTPGGGKGPIGYDLFVVDEEEANVVNIGKGELKDIEGEQNLNVNPSYRDSCKKLLCKFKMKEGQLSFKIFDMKVDCKIAE